VSEDRVVADIPHAENPFTEEVNGFTIAELRESIAYIHTLPKGLRWRFLPHQDDAGPSMLAFNWVGHAEDAFDYIEALEAENAALRAALDSARSTAPGEDWTPRDPSDRRFAKTRAEGGPMKGVRRER